MSTDNRWGFAKQQFQTALIPQILLNTLSNLDLNSSQFTGYAQGRSKYCSVIYTYLSPRLVDLHHYRVMLLQRMDQDVELLHKDMIAIRQSH
jgi:hypothetical protein